MMGNWEKESEKIIYRVIQKKKRPNLHIDFKMCFFVGSEKGQLVSSEGNFTLFPLMTMILIDIQYCEKFLRSYATDWRPQNSY